MRKSLLRGFFSLIISLMWTMSANAQARVDGQVYSMLYGLENGQSTQQWDYFQGFNIRVRPASRSGLSFKTNFRLARRGNPSDWNERVYNAYLDYRSSKGKILARVGRQFLYRGVITGSVDGVSATIKPTKRLSLQVIGGSTVSWDRALKVRSFDNAGIIGLYSEYRFPGKGPRVDASFVEKHSSGKTAWRQMGAGVAGSLDRVLFYQAQIEYNLKSTTVQSMRYRLTYRPEVWSFSAEFNSQKPRVFEDSFFNIFKLVAADQFRIGAAWRSSSAQVGLRFVHTSFEREASSDEVFVTTDFSFGTVGFVYKTGFGGDNTGVFGDIRFQLARPLEVRVRSSYYNYERRSLTFSEDAVSFSAGVRYRPLQSVLINADLQQSSNSFYDNDLRLLLRVSYAFR
jgi:hypothetical protein